MKNKKLKKLITKHKLIDQTGFIEDLLKLDHQMKYVNGLVNISWYKTKTSTGKFKGTEVQYLRILKKMQFEMDTTSDSILKEQIRRDITAIEDSYKGERKVKQWYAVPYWMGKDLENNGEVLLYGSGSCWWGLTSNSLNLLLNLNT